MSKSNPRKPACTMGESADLSRLLSLRSEFSANSAVRKTRLLNKLGKVKFTNSVDLLAYHDLLTFMFAYPDTSQSRKLAESELAGFLERVVDYLLNSKDKAGLKLYNSGLDGTMIEYPFSFGVVDQLTEAFPHSVNVIWDDVDDEVQDKLMEIVQLLLAWHENDAIDNDDYQSTAGWLELARSPVQASDLRLIIDLFRRAPLPDNVRQHLYDGLDITVNWDLTDCPVSRTQHRLPGKQVFYQKQDFRRRCQDLRKELKKPASRLQALGKTEGRQLVMAINQVLAVRARELFPITYANPAEVYRFEPGRGVQLYVFGASPEIRLPFESNYGAMLVRNGIPIGYGVGATLFDRVEIAINVFPAFRGGESAFIIEQFFKLFYHHFGSRIFLVRSRQMGDGDDEPIKAGSFWFYYKLGFRAIEQRIRNLAEEEYGRIRQTRGYRSSERMLRRLSKSDVFMHIDPNQMDGFDELPLQNLGYIVTRYAADKFGGNRQEMTRESSRRLARTLKVGDLKSWTSDERNSLDRLSPLLVNIPGLKNWSSTDRDLLTQCIRAKGGARERRFAILTNRHRKFRDTLWDMATSNEQSM